MALSQTHGLGLAVAEADALINNNKKKKIEACGLIPGRRHVVFGLSMGMVVMVDDRRNADAAARRPPPPPPSEKKDPNVNGVLAKVLASKKRKEAMKDAIAKLRERGNPIIK